MSITSLILRGGAHSRRLPFRIFAVALLASCLYPVSPSGSDEALPRAAALLDKHLEAMGGRAAHEKLHNRVTKGTFAIVGMGAKAKITTYGAAPQKQPAEFAMTSPHSANRYPVCACNNSMIMP